MRVLVVGGAGYVGAQVLQALHERGHSLLTLDTLSTGHRDAVRWGRFVRGDASALDDLDRCFGEFMPDAVILMASRSIVAESFANASEHVRSNVDLALTVQGCMERHGISKLVFSSSAAVYGAPPVAVIDESCPVEPVSPYGVSKLMIEQLFGERARNAVMSAVSLRYFNAAGADPVNGIGESHNPETHLIPLLLSAALSGSRFTMYGDHHPTDDGSCIRDFVHVIDIARAHVLALDFLENNFGFHALNVGSGQGFSVLEVVRSAEKVTGVRIPIDVERSRPFDPPRLVASRQLAQSKLGWEPVFSDIDEIVESAWRWIRDPAY